MRQTRLAVLSCMFVLTCVAVAQTGPERNPRPGGNSSGTTTGWVQVTPTAIIFADGTQQTTANASGVVSVTTAAGGGIASGGTNGAITLGLITSCGNGQVLKWSAGAWSCADDNNASGTVTSIVAGSGLTGGTITSTGTLAVDDTVVRAADPRLSDARNPLPGSNNYIQSSPAGAQAANINISGNITLLGVITGNGSGLTSVQGGNVVGTVPSASFAQIASNVAAATSDPACNSATAGAIYLNTTTGTVRYCNGTSWIDLAQSAYEAAAPYCGGSPSTYTGNIQFSATTGYQAAKSICASACGSAKAHMCSSEEMVRSAQLGANLPTAWYSTGVPSWGAATTAGDCGGWKSNSSASSGTTWSANGPVPSNCASSVAIACCL